MKGIIYHQLLCRLWAKRWLLVRALGLCASIITSTINSSTTSHLSMLSSQQLRSASHRLSNVCLCALYPSSYSASISDHTCNWSLDQKYWLIIVFATFGDWFSFSLLAGHHVHHHDSPLPLDSLLKEPVNVLADVTEHAISPLHASHVDDDLSLGSPNSRKDPLATKTRYAELGALSAYYVCFLYSTVVVDVKFDDSLMQDDVDWNVIILWHSLIVT